METWVLLLIISLIIGGIFSLRTTMRGSSSLSKMEKEFEDGILIENYTSENFMNDIKSLNNHEILSVSGSENKVCVEGKHGTHNYTVENNTIKAIYPYVGFKISKIGRFLTFLSIPKKVSNYAECNKILWQINQLHNSQLSSTQLDYDKLAKGTKTGKNLTLLFCAVALISAIGFINSFTGNTKAIVTDAAPEAYPDITIGQAFENFFDDPTWDYYQSDAGMDIVEFQGGCTLSDAPATAIVKFKVDKSDNTFEIAFLSIDGEQQDSETLEALLQTVFETAQEDLDN